MMDDKYMPVNTEFTFRNTTIETYRCIDTSYLKDIIELLEKEWSNIKSSCIDYCKRVVVDYTNKKKCDIQIYYPCTAEDVRREGIENEYYTNAFKYSKEILESMVADQLPDDWYVYKVFFFPDYGIDNIFIDLRNSNVSYNNDFDPAFSIGCAINKDMQYIRNYISLSFPIYKDKAILNMFDTYLNK